MKTKYYQRNKERLQKDASERNKNHFKGPRKVSKFFGRRKT